MKSLFVLPFAVILLLVAGCASTPTQDIKVDAQADPKARFSGYKTYAWLGSARLIADEDGVWEPPGSMPTPNSGS